MSNREVRPYGSWRSPISAAQIASGTLTLAEIQLDGGDIYWLETRPDEGGRNVVVRRRADGRIEDCIPDGFNARTRAHEYGGGAYLVAEGVVYFSNFADQRLYRHHPGRGGTPEPMTPAGDVCYADGIWDRRRRRILCVREDHTAGGEPANTLVAVDAERGGPGEILLSGRDFYAAPRLDPDGIRLAFLAWDHPNMPWDAAELWMASVRADGSLGAPEHIAGGEGDSAIQPSWSPEGILHFVSDRTGWWNLYRVQDGRAEALTRLEGEFAQPPWVFGMSHYAFAVRLVSAYTQGGTWKLATVDRKTRRLEPVDTPYTGFASVRSDGRWVVLLAGSPIEPWSVIRLDPDSGQQEVIRRATELRFDPGYLSTPAAIEFPTTECRTAHGIFYAPRNKDFVAPEGERPPLLVMIHGGPTSATTTVLRLGIQYYTSRGFAVLDVNYGGSTGYGREYRERLYGQWGVVDVDDCCHGAHHLAAQGLVDARRLAITGGSAGGYTALACLAFRDVFAAGASHYGVSDCEILAKETHKFEARYLDTLIGPYPERRDLYLERSPLYHLESLRRPVIFFQGLDDKVVPPNQAEMMFKALRERGVPTAYVPFPGEQHGFRRAENIRRALEGEFYFFSRVFGFKPADAIDPVPIENL
ncbi:MAG TPA: S9 family peptidase [Candidatus Methylomirabilis sp.]|nr:S9 family peptidase [Candidatus Methylomirabilis sp.]